MKLYLIAGCPFAHRAAIALAEKGLAHETVVYTPAARPKELDAVSPHAKSPTLFDGDDAVYESAVVLEYLEDKYPAKALLPSGAKARADVRVVIARIAEELGGKFGAIAQAKFRPDSSAEAVAEAGKAFAAALAPWNLRLAGKTYLVGDTFSIADITLYTLFPAAKHLADVAIPSELTHLVAWRDRVAARPSAPFPAPSA